MHMLTDIVIGLCADLPAVEKACCFCEQRSAEKDLCPVHMYSSVQSSIHVFLGGLALLWPSVNGGAAFCRPSEEFHL